MTSPDATWPTATLSDIARLRVLAEGMRGLIVHERRIAAPFDSVWSFVTDLEHSVPIWDRDVASVRIVHHDGQHLDIRARGTWRVGGLPLRFDVELQPGWCWMVSRPQFYVVAMAAEPDGDGTRFAHLEGVALRHPPWLAPAARPLLGLSRWRHRRHVPRDVDGIERALGLRRH
jgi:hypothetical protein